MWAWKRKKNNVKLKKKTINNIEECELGSSRRAPRILNDWAISWAPICYNSLNNRLNLNVMIKIFGGGNSEREYYLDGSIVAAYCTYSHLQ